MCGIAGLFAPQLNQQTRHELSERMVNALIHRGPDDGAVWTDSFSPIGFGFRRLAIVDLSVEGRQPMLSACGRYVVVFNGEIYNFLELRKEIESSGKFPYAFRGHSDTEVMAAGLTIWGLEALLPKLNGMFAIAVWDRQNRSLSLVRDRLGKKPLYYGWVKSSFLFGSELKALAQFPGFHPAVDRAALTLFFRYSYIPAPHTIYSGIYKLIPGTFLTISEATPPGQHKLKTFYSSRDTVRDALAKPFVGSDEEALDGLHELLSHAVKCRMIADVPLGAFLSGGIDSSLIVALMQAQSTSPVKTFTIGFTDKAYNEAPHAKSVSTHLGTSHTELYVSPQEAMAVIPQLPKWYDEPFADSSQIPTLLVAQLARKHVTVALSGDGGDELFGGYQRYLLGEKPLRSLFALPRSSRWILSNLIKCVPQETIERMTPFLPKRLQTSRPADMLLRFANVLGAENPMQLYHETVSFWKDPASLVLRAKEPMTAFLDPSLWQSMPSSTEAMMLVDLLTYLPNDILAKVDRATMGVSLEARGPLLDYRLIQFAWTLPLKFKIRHGRGKWILRKLLTRYLPSNLVERPKMGFALPMGQWLRGPLRDWVEESFSEVKLKRQGYLNVAQVQKAWNLHLKGEKHDTQLWTVLMFQSWLDLNSLSNPVQPN